MLTLGPARQTFELTHWSATASSFRCSTRNGPTARSTADLLDLADKTAAMQVEFSQRQRPRQLHAVHTVARAQA
ncbi:MAG: hypothetical protein HPM95_04215 [Alphaproteobacteria bacterium]|nr:hypothetical protein [Alphaproteobacteria bacterium]